MARSGSFNTGNYDGRYLTFEWSYASHSVENNTTTINWSLKGAGGTSYMWYMTGNVKVVIDGKTVYENATRFQLYSGTVVASGQATLTHDADGKKTFKASAQAGIYLVAVNCSGSGEWTLDPIARATTPTFNKTTVITGEKLTIYTPRQASGFTHNLKYEFNKAKGTIATGVGTSYTWTINRNLASQYPNSDFGSMTIICETYNGSQLIGTKKGYVIVKFNEADVPTISSITLTDAVSGIASKFGAFVQGKSKLKVAISSSGVYGSTISSVETVIGKTTYTESGFTTDFLQESGTVNVGVTVVDSRARSTTETRQINVLHYTVPTVSRFNVERCLQDGTPDIEGTYVKVSLKYTITPLNNKNDASYRVEYKEKQATSWTTLKTGTGYTFDGSFVSSTGNFNVDYSYDVRVVIKDYFSETPWSDEIESSFSLIDFNVNGDALAFGKSSERSGVIESALPFYDQYDTVITNGMAQYTGNGNNAIDPNTTLDNLVCTNKNTPNSEWFFIETTFYNDKTVTSDRSQIAKPYYRLQSMYHRVYSNGAWSEWRRHLNADESIAPAQHNHEYNGSFGRYRFNDGWFGMYASNADAKNHKNRRAWLGFDNGNMLQLNNEYSYSTRLNFKNGSGVALQGDANKLDFMPLSLAINLGSAYLNWKQIYAQNTNISTSDRELKKDFTKFDERYEALFFDLKPQLFKFKNGESDRLHSGFISQDVEDSLAKVGLDAKKFAGFCKDQKVEFENVGKENETQRKVFDENGEPEYTYALRYEEFIALNTYIIQKQQKEIDALKKTVDDLKNMIKGG